MPTTEQLNEWVTDLKIDLFTRRIQGLEDAIKAPDFKSQVKYHSESINKAFSVAFEEITTALQNTVDAFYVGYYEVTGFMPFSFDFFDQCLIHNMGLISNCKKLLKFIE